MSGRRRAWTIVGAVVLGLVALWFAAGIIRVPLRFDATGVRSLQLNGGTLALADAGEPSLRASVPLRALPVLMARRTDGLLEIGGFDDSDPRVLLMFPLLSAVPAAVDDVRWELSAPELEQITVAGGELAADGLERDTLAIFAVSGAAELRDVEIGTLAIHAQGGTVTITGHAGTFGTMSAGGKLDSSRLAYDAYDRQMIVDYFEE